MPITGSYPGGPTRKSEKEDDARSPRTRLSRAEEIENRLHRRHRTSVRRKRKRRLLVGFIVALAIAGAAGFWMGFQANTTSEEIAAQQEQSGDGELDLTRERNLILQQLWLMEDLERAPRP